MIPTRRAHLRVLCEVWCEFAVRGGLLEACAAG